MGSNSSTGRGSRDTRSSTGGSGSNRGGMGSHQSTYTGSNRNTGSRADSNTGSRGGNKDNHDGNHTTCCGLSSRSSDTGRGIGGAGNSSMRVCGSGSRTVGGGSNTGGSNSTGRDTGGSCSACISNRCGLAGRGNLINGGSHLCCSSRSCIIGSITAPGIAAMQVVTGAVEIRRDCCKTRELYRNTLSTASRCLCDTKKQGGGSVLGGAPTNSTDWHPKHSVELLSKLGLPVTGAGARLMQVCRY